MNTGWPVQRLGSVATVSAGNSAPQDKSLFARGTHTFIRTSDVGQIRVGEIRDSADKLNDLGVRGMRKFREGVTLVPKSGASTFNNHRVITAVEATVSSHLAVVDAHHGVLDDRYVFYFLQTVRAQDLIGDQSYPSLNLTHLESVEIPVPPLAEQQRIVAKLDEVDTDLRTLSERLDTELLQSAQVRLSAMNELLDQNRGKKVKLGDILSLEYGKPLDPSRRDSSAAVPVYGANGVKTFTSRALYEEPTIVVGRKGSAGELALTDGPCWPLDVTYYVVHDRAVTDLVFLHTLLKKCDLPRLAKGVKPGINRNEVYELECLLPSLAEQQQIVARLGEVDSVCAEVSENIERRKAKAGELRQSVLAAAFRGGL